MISGGSLRCGHSLHSDVGREVRLTYGRRSIATPAGQGELFQVSSDPAPWGGSEILPRFMASHFAEDYIKLLTGRDLAPDFLLGDGVSRSYWEAAIESWVYFIELTWATPERDYVLQLSPRAQLARSRERCTAMTNGELSGLVPQKGDK